MKKLSLYVFLVLMFCNVGFAECIEGDCINGYGTYTTDGSKYVGEFKDVAEKDMRKLSNVIQQSIIRYIRSKV